NQFFGRYYSAKVNSAGVFQWGNSYDQGQIWDPYFGKDIAVYSPNVIYSTGFVYENGTTNDMIVIRYDQNGDTVWTRRFSYYHYYGGQWTTEDQGRQVETDQYGNAYVLTTNVDDQINVLIKYDSTGVRQWVKRVNNSPTIIVNMILYEDEIYMGGNIDPGTGMGLALACKMDLNGNYVFNNTNPFFNVTITDMDRYGKGIVMTGNSYTCNGCNWDGHTLMFDSIGNNVWNYLMDTQQGMFTDQPYGITSSKTGGVYVTGNGHGSSYWMNTYKLFPCDKISPSVTHNGTLHSANFIPGALYTWRDCANDSIVASGDELNIYAAPYPGNFEVEISIGTCSDSTLCNPTNVFSLKDEIAVSVFPNPATDYFYVNGIQKALCSIYSIDGRYVKSILAEKKKAVDISDLIPGIYILSVPDTDVSRNFRFVKGE
ncbi:MAG: T9SS type A sorting domain-containing protein, partial [Bacteroidota bacterium]